MRYMLLVYSTEVDGGPPPEEKEQIRNGHRAVIEEAARTGALISAEPLAPTSSATTVRQRDSRLVIMDGPFAETKEQLAGYYMLKCVDLDEAIDWASKIPTSCKGLEGCVEIRPMLETGTGHG